MSLTLIHDRRKRTNEQFKRLREMERTRQDAELQGHLKAAATMLAGKTGIPLNNVVGLSNSQQVALLEEYADRLEEEAREFLEMHPDKAGAYAARYFQTEKLHVLNHIVRLRIGIAKGETG